jgi:hypothetical protein
MPKVDSPLKALGKQLKESRKKLPPNVIVRAGAGCGKTTTLVEGMKMMRGIETLITPSAQQKAVWDQMMLSKDAYSVCFTSFGKEPAVQMGKKIPAGCESMTLHQMGSRMVRKAFPMAKLDKKGEKDSLIIGKVLNVDIYRFKNSKFMEYQSLMDAIEKCKLTLIDGTEPMQVEDMLNHFDIVEGRDLIFKHIEEILELSMDIKTTGMYTFPDMIWIPIVQKLPIFKFDLLLVDEFQDLNRCQQELALLAGHRIIGVGDENQSIFAFAGADQDSMKRLENRLRNTPNGVEVLFLNETRRCAKAIVREAQKTVPDFFAHESNPEGEVLYDQLEDTEFGDSYRKRVEDGDMVLCRYNAPLVSQCFKFLKGKRKAQIRGREIGGSLIRIIFRALRYRGDIPDFTNSSRFSDDVSLVDLESGLQEWLASEVSKERSKKFVDETKINGKIDCCECIKVFCSDSKSAAEVVVRINQVFTDTTCEGIMLSSIHKAKGLECKTVWLLQPQSNSKYRKPAPKWQSKQETNLEHVGITRAMNKLVYVH